jgi:uncharacterized protein DUF5681
MGKIMSNNEKQPKASSAGTYEVGYGKPPKNSQFQKGKSGNPKGRPKGSKSVPSLAQEHFLKLVTVTVNGKSTKMPMVAAFLAKLSAEAMKGDLKALKLVLDMCAKYITEPGSHPGAGQTPFELTADEYDSILKHKLLKGVL